MTSLNPELKQNIAVNQIIEQLEETQMKQEMEMQREKSQEYIYEPQVEVKRRPPQIKNNIAHLLQTDDFKTGSNCHVQRILKQYGLKQAKKDIYD